ncbi:ATP-binding protein [Actinomadura atramentaria]|uniref:ATP-binding protein n=1 Tax=Actinomadura atramentaria TaxID=1990 RepID=UPI00036D51B2|nr:ATP-binding protein [Actinomadura atramentaria]
MTGATDQRARPAAAPERPAEPARIPWGAPPSPAHAPRPAVWGAVALTAAAVLALFLLAAVVLLATGARLGWPVPLAGAAVAALLLTALALREHRDRLDRAADRALAARRAAELADAADRARVASLRLGEWEAYATALRGRADALEELTRRLLLAYLPAAVQGDRPPRLGPEPAELLGPELAATMTAALESIVELRRDLADREDSYQQVMVALARRVQSASHRMQLAAERIAEENRMLPEVYRAGQAMDHAASQAARVAQSVAILAGSWEGQQWTRGLRLAEIVQAASARIEDFGRVRIEGDPDVGVDPVALEPVVHVIAELLANATEASPTATDVIVKVSAAASGAVFRIDDHGTGLEEPRLSHARDVAAGRVTPSLADLGEVPRTGLAVVGRYAVEHGLKITLDESPYGGLQAVVLVPAGRTIRVAPRGSAAFAHPTPEPPPAPPAGLPTASTPPAGTPYAGKPDAGLPHAKLPHAELPPIETPRTGPQHAGPSRAESPDTGTPRAELPLTGPPQADPPPIDTPRTGPSSHAGPSHAGPPRADLLAARAPRAESPLTDATPTDATRGDATPSGGSVLPQRRNRRRPAHVPPPAAGPAVAAPDQTPEDAASFMAGVFAVRPDDAADADDAPAAPSAEPPATPADDPGDPRE